MFVWWWWNVFIHKRGKKPMNIFHTNKNYIVCHGFDHSFAGTQKDALYAYTHYSLEESFSFIHFFRSLKLWLIQWRIDIFGDWIKIIQLSFLFSLQNKQKRKLSQLMHLYVLVVEFVGHIACPFIIITICRIKWKGRMWSFLMFDGISQNHVKIKHSLRI